MGCKNYKIGHVTLTTPPSGTVVVRKLAIDIAYNDTKFDDSIALAVSEIFQGV